MAKSVWEELPPFEEEKFFEKMKSGLKEAEEEAPPEFLRPYAEQAAGMAKAYAKAPRMLANIPFGLGSMLESGFRKLTGVGPEIPYSTQLAEKLNLTEPSKLEEDVGQRFEDIGVEPGQFGEETQSNVLMGIPPGAATVMGAKNTLIDQLSKGSIGEPYAENIKMATDFPLLMKKPTASLPSVLSKEKETFARLAQKYGLSEEEITPLIQGDIKEEILTRMTSGGKQLTSTSERVVGKLIKAKDDILGSVFEGYKEGGASGIQKHADELFENITKTAKRYDLVATNPRGMKMSVAKVINKLQKIRGKSTETEAFLNHLKKTYRDVASGKMTISEMMDTYKELNKEWRKSGTAKAYIDPIKQAVKQNIRKVKVGKNPIGERMAERFEAANFGYHKAAQYEEIGKKLSSVFHGKEANFDKLGSLMEHEPTFKLFEDVLGKESAKNLKEISQIGEKTQGIVKAFTNKNVDLVRKLGAGGVAIGGIVAAFFNPKLAAELIGGGIISHFIGKKMLMDPKYQNVWKRTTEVLNKGKWNIAKNLANRFARQAIKDFKQHEQTKSQEPTPNESL
jgi:hypothetical protein